MTSRNEEDQGGGSSKRKMDSLGAKDYGNERKKMAPAKLKKLRQIMDEVYCGVVLNEFVQQGIKDACKEMKSIVEEMIVKEEQKDTNYVDLSTKCISELMKENMIVNWVMEGEPIYGEMVEVRGCASSEKRDCDD